MPVRSKKCRFGFLEALSLLIVLGGVMEPECLAAPAMKTAKQAPGRTRTISFAACLGELYTMERSDYGLLPGRALGRAEGALSVPANMPVYLDVSYEGLKNLAALKNLQANDLGGLSLANKGRGFPIEDSSLDCIAHLSGLQSLTIEQSDIGDEGVKRLANLKNLEILNLNHTLISPAATKTIAALSKLSELDLDGNRLNNQSLAELTNLKNLQKLQLRNCGLSAGALRFTQNWANLTELKLGGNKIGNEGAASLPIMPKIFELNLDRCDLSDQGLISLGKQSGLVKLFARGNHISRAGLRGLAQARNLNYLNISGSPVDPHALSELRPLKKLSTVVISTEPSALPAAQQETLKAAQRALPGVKVVLDSPRLPLEIFAPLPR